MAGMRAISNLLIVMTLGAAFGWWLSLPMPDATARAHRVQEGETLGTIAEANGATVIDLIALNAVRHPGLVARGEQPLPAGWELTLQVGDEAMPRWSAWLLSAAGAILERVGPMLQAKVAELVPPPVPQRSASAGASNPTAPAGFDYDGALEIVRLTNEQRAAAGLPPLTIDEGLMEIARKRATEVVGDWGHQGLWDDCGACAENIIQGPGQATMGRLVTRWMESDGHRANILGPGLTRMGVGVYRAENGVVYAVQNFQ